MIVIIISQEDCIAGHLVIAVVTGYTLFLSLAHARRQAMSNCVHVLSVFVRFRGSFLNKLKKDT